MCKHSGSKIQCRTVGHHPSSAPTPQCIAPSTLAGPDNTRLQHFPQVVLNLFNQWWRNLSKSFLKGSVIHNFYCVFCGMGTAQFCTGSNENTSWYLARSQWAASTSFGAHESRPLKSNSSNNLPCLCLMVSLGVWGSWGSSAPSSNCTSSGVWAQATLLLPWPLGFSSRGSVSMPCCSLPP